MIRNLVHDTRSGARLGSRALRTGSSRLYGMATAAADAIDAATAGRKYDANLSSSSDQDGANRSKTRGGMRDETKSEMDSNRANARDAKRRSRDKEALLLHRAKQKIKKQKRTERRSKDDKGMIGLADTTFPNTTAGIKGTHDVGDGVTAGMPNWKMGTDVLQQAHMVRDYNLPGIAHQLASRVVYHLPKSL